VYIAANSTVKLNSGSITGNINSSSVAGNTGGGVYVQWNSTNPNFTKTGGTIYGDMDNTHTPGSTENTAPSTSNPGTNGHAVFLEKTSPPPTTTATKT
jgi:hypothetical protein